MARLSNDFLSSRCRRLYNFLYKKYEFCNLHMVDFITDDHWSKLSPQLQEELLTLKQCDPLKCFSSTSELKQMEIRLPVLAKFVREARENSWQELTLEGYVFSGIEDDHHREVCPTRRDVYSSVLHKFQIQEKKQHEVEVMAEFVARLAKNHNTQLVVDFGSGKGYIASLLALLYDLEVLGIESSEPNVCSAIGRNEKVSTMFTRALKQMQETQVEGNGHETRNSVGRFVPIATTLTRSTDITELLKTDPSNDDLPSRRALFCALHACGYLSCTILKHFVSCSNAAVICLVGCCYHMLDEWFTTSTYCSESSQEKDCGFPMSSLLKQQKAVIGQNARMLAMQSVERSAIAKPSRSLFFRAVLQVLLRDHFGPSAKFEVGRLPIKESTTFESYAQKAIKKLKLQQPLQLSSKEFEDYIRNYQEWESKVNAFQQLRILMAPSIECLILLDRALYLLEQENIHSCYLMSLFDPVKSPRCLALVAAKS